MIAALALALGAFDAEHVELAFDVAEDQIAELLTLEPTWAYCCSHSRKQ